MKCRVLEAGEAGDWNEALKRFPMGDVYFSSEYHQAHALNGDGEARAFVAEDGADRLFHPFMLRPIKDVAGESVADAGWKDIETVYGYTGPIGSTTDEAFLDAAWGAFSEWCAGRRVVAEFIRFNPLLGNHVFAGASCGIAAEQPTVLMDLSGSDDDFLKRYPSVQRNMLRKAQAKGLVGGEEADPAAWEDFRRLYDDTMRRVGSRDYYLFSDAYHDRLRAGLGTWSRLFTVRDGSRTVAAALFLLYGDRMHYHLAGSDPDYKAAAANNLLIHAAALWGRRQGFLRLHLGGGRSGDPKDGLLAFKAGLSKERLAFRAGRRVHDEAAYEKLCALWMDRRGAAARPPYFLLYRRED